MGFVTEHEKNLVTVHMKPLKQHSNEFLFSGTYICRSMTIPSHSRGSCHSPSHISMLHWTFTPHATSPLCLPVFPEMSARSEGMLFMVSRSAERFIKNNTFTLWSATLLILAQVRLTLRQNYCAPQVQPHRGLNSWPPDHDSTFHVTETPALTARPSVSSKAPDDC